MTTLAMLLHSDRTSRTLWALLIALQLAVAIYQVLHGPTITIDSTEYLRYAHNIWEGRGFQANDPTQIYTPEMVTHRLPGYPLFLLLCALQPALIVIVQALLALATVHLTLKCMANFGNPATWIRNVLLAGFIATPAHWLYSGTIMAETLFQALLLQSLYHTLAFQRSSNLRALAWASLALAFSIWVKPVVYLVTLPWALLAIGWAWKKRCGAIVAWGLVPLLTVLATCAWNAQRTGVFEISSLQNHNLLNYNMRLTMNSVVGPDSSDALIESVKARVSQLPSYSARQQLRKEAAMELFHAHPVHYALVHLRGMGVTLLDPGRFDWLTFFKIPIGSGFMLANPNMGMEGWIAKIRSAVPLWLAPILLLTLFINILKVIGLAMILFSPWHRHSAMTILCSALVLYMLVLTGPVGVARYAVAFLPQLLILSALGWGQCIARRK